MYTGVCLELSCGISFCAERAAVAAMLQNRETVIVKIVAVDENAQNYVLAPCGRCIPVQPLTIPGVTKKLSLWVRSASPYGCKYESGDHQFWLTLQADQKRVYVGQWKRGEEIPETRYDIAGIQSVVVRKGDGYVMECLIPAARIQGFNPAAGARLGINMNLSVKGNKQNREVYWVTPKAESADQPAAWGAITREN